MSKKVTDREAKAGKKKKQVKEINFGSLLTMGIIFIVAALILGMIFPNIPDIIPNIMYIIGVISLVVYMIQIAFEKRTGKAELTDKEIAAMKKEQKKKSKGK